MGDAEIRLMRSLEEVAERAGDGGEEGETEGDDEEPEWEEGDEEEEESEGEGDDEGDEDGEGEEDDEGEEDEEEEGDDEGEDDGEGEAWDDDGDETETEFGEDHDTDEHVQNRAGQGSSVHEPTTSHSMPVTVSSSNGAEIVQRNPFAPGNIQYELVTPESPQWLYGEHWDETCVVAVLITEEVRDPPEAPSVLWDTEWYAETLISVVNLAKRRPL